MRQGAEGQRGGWHTMVGCTGRLQPITPSSHPFLSGAWLRVPVPRCLGTRVKAQ